MLDPKKIRENFDEINSILNKRNFMIDKKKFESIDNNRKNIIADTESLQNKKNTISKEIGILKSKGEETTIQTESVEQINLELKEKQSLLIKAEDEYNDFLLNIPNILHKSVPHGKSDLDNKIIKYSNDENLENMTKNTFVDHSEIGKLLNLYDQDIAVKMSSSRFSLLFGSFAQLIH